MNSIGVNCYYTHQSSEVIDSKLKEPYGASFVTKLFKLSDTANVLWIFFPHKTIAKLVLNTLNHALFTM